jgi:hypothetical protein
MRCNIVRSDHDGRWYVWWDNPARPSTRLYAYGDTREEALNAAVEMGFDTRWLDGEQPWLAPGESEDALF